MKKGTGIFKQIEETIIVCDECGKEIDILINHIQYDYTWNDGWDSYGDRDDFCSLECLIKNLSANIYEHESMYFPGGQFVSLSVPSDDMKTILNKLI